MVIYQAPNGAVELRGDFKKETVWATQAQIAQLFDIERSVATKHIRNIFKDYELDKKSVCANFAHTAPDGKTYKVDFYNLDLILSIGYRTNSKKAIEFRKWATKTLREHIIQGYTINRKRVSKNYESFMKAVHMVKQLLPTGEKLKATDTLELIKMFANTWFSLDAYDKSKLPKKGFSKKQVVFTAGELTENLFKLKKDLLKKKEATEIFGQEKQVGNLAGIVGNVLQSFFNKDAYQTIEEKAVHLLYFIIKNHPFTDDNKRSGAFAFIWFLRRAGILDIKKITPEALTAITILIAESNPKDKDKITGLVMMLLKK